MLGLCAILLITILATIIPGYCILAALPPEVRGKLEVGKDSTLVAMAFSFIAIAVLQLITWGLQTPPALTNAILYALLVGGLGAWLHRNGRFTRCMLPSGSGFLAWIFFVLYLFELLMLEPSYETAFTADWGLYYPNSAVYLNLAPISAFAAGMRLDYLVHRTPFLSLFGSFFLSLLGDDYFCYQIVILVVNSWVFWIVRLWAGLLFGARAVFASLLLLLVSPAVLRLVSTPEPKMIGTFFVLLAVYFYGRTRAANLQEGRYLGVLAAGFGVTAYMCHPSMLLYVGWLFVDQIYLRLWKGRALNREFWGGAVMAVLVLVVPWNVCMGMRLGWAAVLHPATTVSQPLALSAGGYIMSRVDMVLSSLLVPLPLLEALGSVPWPSVVSGATADMDMDLVQLWGNLWLRFYQHTFLGGLTLAASVATLALGWRHRPRWKAPLPRRLAYGWMAMGALSCVLAHLSLIDTKGQAINLMAPLFVLVLCYAGHVLGQVRPWIAVLVTVISMAELTVVRWLIPVVTAGLPTRGLTYVYHLSAAGVEAMGGAFLVGLGLTAAAYALTLFTAFRQDSR